MDGLLALVTVALTWFTVAPGSARPTGSGTSATLAVGWCVLITVASYLWARRLHRTRAGR